MKEPTKKPLEPATDVWPEEIRLTKSKSLLDVRFDNGKSFSISAEFCGWSPLRPKCKDTALTRKPHRLANGIF